MKRAVIVLAFLFLAFSISPGVLASEDWTVTVTADNGVSPVTFGVNSQATSGYDQQYDNPMSLALPAGEYSLMSFYSPMNSPASLQTLSTSIFSSIDDSWTWTLVLQNFGSATNITLSWDSEAIVVDQLILTLPSLDSVNMKTQSNCTFQAKAYDLLDPGASLYTLVIYAASTGSSDPTDAPTLNPTATQTADPTPSMTPYGLPEIGPLSPQIRGLIVIVIAVLIVGLAVLLAKKK